MVMATAKAMGMGKVLMVRLRLAAMGKSITMAMGRQLWRKKLKLMAMVQKQ